MTFKNPIVALSGSLSFPSIHSPDYASSGGATGWSINRDGTATFNTTGGSFQITTAGLFFYTPAAGSGTLIASFANTAGVDQYGNSYDAGFFLNQKQAHLTGDQSDTVMINPNGAFGPEILFAEAGFGFATHFQQFTNELRAEAVNASGALFRINMPVLATGGYQSAYSQQGGTPPLNVNATYTAYTSLAWTPITILCPPSETVQVTMTLRGRNNSSVNASISLGFNVTAGATTLFTPTDANISQNGPHWNNDGVTARINDINVTTQMLVGSNILSGRTGQSITFTPMWRVSSNTGTQVGVNFGSMFVAPQLYNSPNSSVA